MYDAKKHVQKEWQVIACGVITVTAIGVGFSLPVKTGEIPIARLCAFAASGAIFATGAAIDKSKAPLDLQKKVIDTQEKRVFLAAQTLATAIRLEDQHLEGERLVAQKVRSSDV